MEEYSDGKYTDMEYADPAPAEYPILLTDRQARAVLAGTMTQIRRVMEPQPVWWEDYERWLAEHAEERRAQGYPPHLPFTQEDTKDGLWFWGERGLAITGKGQAWPPSMFCPCGRPGDYLWVQEAWHLSGPPERQLLEYRARSGYPEESHWKAGLTMPRHYSRARLRVVGDVRVQRLQDISLADVRAAGTPSSLDSDDPRRPAGAPDIYTFEDFAVEWNLANGQLERSWESNPFVWVHEIAVAEVAPVPRLVPR